MFRTDLFFKIMLLLAGILFLQVPVQAEEHDTQLWLPVSINLPVHDSKWSTTLELQPRFDNHASDLAFLLVRPSVSYQLTPATTATLGYLWTPNFHNSQTEQRIWQQLAYSNSWKKLRLTHQVRLEERFFEGQSDTALRGRYLLTAVKPIKQSRWNWVASNEVFFDLNDAAGIEGGFGQNRSFVGVRKRLGEKSYAESGYLLQYVHGTGASEDQLNHALILRLFLVSGKNKR